MERTYYTTPELEDILARNKEIRSLAELETLIKQNGKDFASWEQAEDVYYRYPQLKEHLPEVSNTRKYIGRALVGFSQISVVASPMLSLFYAAANSQDEASVGLGLASMIISPLISMEIGLIGAITLGPKKLDRLNL